MTPEKLALKRATQEVIRGVGGLEAAAGFCRVGKSALSDAQSVNKPDCFVALDVVADLEPLARGRDDWPQITRLLAQLHGFALVKLPDALPACADVLHLVARQARHGGELAEAICEALRDGHISEGEARTARALNREQIENAVAMDAVLAAIAGEA